MKKLLAFLLFLGLALTVCGVDTVRVIRNGKMVKSTTFNVANLGFNNLIVTGNTLLGDAATDTVTVNAVVRGASPLVFEGTTVDAYETTFAITDPTADRTITFPNLTGSVPIVNMVTLSADASSIDASLGNAFKVPQNTATTSVTAITNGVAGQVIRIVGVGTSNPSNFADSGNFKLSSAFSAVSNATLELMSDGTDWFELSRSSN